MNVEDHEEPSDDDLNAAAQSGNRQLRAFWPKYWLLVGPAGAIVIYCAAFSNHLWTIPVGVIGAFGYDAIKRRRHKKRKR